MRSNDWRACTLSVAAILLLAPLASWAAPPAATGGPLLLQPGRSVVVRLATADGAACDIDLAEGERAGLRLTQQESALMMVLVDPAGTERRRVIRDPTEGGGSVCARPARPDLAWVADAAGRWRVRLLPPEGAPPFDVVLRYAEHRQARAADRSAWEAEQLDARVSAFLDAGQGAKAVTAGRALVEARRREHEGDPLGLASDLGYLGVRFYLSSSCRAGAWDFSEELVRQALDLRRRALPHGDLCVAESLSLVASILYARGGFEEGERLEKESLEIRAAAVAAAGDASAREAAETAWRRSLRDIGLLLLKQGKYGEARDYFQQSFDAVDRLRPADPNALADALHHLGELERSQDRYAAARDDLQRALDLESSATPGDAPLTADIVASLAGLHLDRAEYDDAERYAKRFLDLLEAHPDVATPDRSAIGRNNLGEIYRRQGRLEAARPLLEDSLQAARDALCPENPTLLYFRINLAMLSLEAGDAARAEALERESLDVVERSLGPQHPSVAENLEDLADLLAEQERAREAEPLYARAIAIREAAFGPGHPNVADARVRLARAQFDAGLMQPGTLLPDVESAAAILVASPAYPEAAVEASRLRADLLDRLGRRPEAMQSLALSLAKVETLRPRRGASESARADFLRRHLDDYDRMIAWQLEAGDVGAAFDYAERSRSRAFLDRLTAGSGDLTESLLPADRARFEASQSKAQAALAEAQARAQYERGRTDLAAPERRKRLADLDAQIDAAAAEVRQVADDIRNQSPLWRDAVTAPDQALTLDEVRGRLLARDGWLLFYRVGEKATRLFAIPSAGAPRVLELVVPRAEADLLGVDPGPLTSARLDAILGGTRLDPSSGLLRQIASPPSAASDDVAATTRALAALRRILVPDPVWKSLRKASEAVVVPDGALAQLPFEALVLRAGKSWTQSAAWLDDGPPLRYAASVTVLSNLARRAPAAAGVAPSILSVSDPDYAGRLPRLPGTALETEAVRRAFGAAGFTDAVTVLEGAQATEAAVRAALPEEKYLHLATHGLVDARRSDLLAGLALSRPAAESPGTADDGLLQLFEIDALRLRAQIVVLSACDTGVGRRVEGEGVLSLARGFFAAGAARVIGTLWPVADASTADLVGNLFRSVAVDEAAGRPVAAAAALRDSKLLLRKRPATAAPFYWAPFTLTGLP